MNRRLPVQAKTDARTLRRRMTDAEARLWYNLRRHGLSGHKFSRQNPLGPYILDFCCPAAKLVVEVDGGQHFESSHEVADKERTKYLEELGLRVVRFTNAEVMSETDSVLNAIHEALVTPLPNPLPRGARGQPGAEKGAFPGESRTKGASDPTG